VPVIFSLLILASCQAPRGVFWWGNCEKDIDIKSRVIQIQTDGYFRGPRPNELIGCLDVPERIDESKFKVAQSVHLGELNKDDLLQYSVTLEVTNESYSEDWMIARYLVLADSSSNVNGQAIRRAYGYNCTPQMHHCDLSDSGIYKVKQYFKDAYLNLVIYAAGSKMERAAFEVNQGYGDFEGFIKKGGPAWK
jgi:hypothetical protein